MHRIAWRWRTSSVWTNRLLKAGWAASAAAGASTTSAKLVSSIVVFVVAAIGEADAPELDVVLGRDADLRVRLQIAVAAAKLGAAREKIAS